MEALRKANGNVKIKKREKKDVFKRQVEPHAPGPVSTWGVEGRCLVPASATEDSQAHLRFVNRFYTHPKAEVTEQQLKI